MAAPLFIMWNGNSSALTAPLGPIASAATVTPKTMQQLQLGTPYNDANNVTRTATPSATATCYGPTAEGTITATRLLAATMDLATYFKQQFPLGREPEVAPSNFLRIRVTPSTAAAVSVISYFVWEE